MAEPTSNEELLDALIRHQTYLLRYSGYVRNRINAILQKSEADIAAKIRDKLAGNAGLTTPVEVRRLQALLKALDGIRIDGWKEVNQWWQDEMIGLAYQEPIALAAMISTVTPTVVSTVLPAPRLLRAIVLSQPFEGRVLRDWAQTMASDDIRRIHSAVQLGMVAGESSSAIAARVVGTGLLKGTDGVTEATRRQVQAITRTAVQHVANTARNEFMEENADIVLEELFVATLDSRTTPVCRANDGKRFDLGKGPRPPLHIGCRSLRVAALDGTTVGARPAKASTTKQLLREYTSANSLPPVTARDDLPRGTKTDYDAWARKRVRELTGQVPASTTYQTWLAKQSNAFQDDTLGVTKAKLFRDGKLTLDKFVAADGSELSLSQLAVKHRDAFRAAGLDPAAFN